MSTIPYKTASGADSNRMGGRYAMMRFNSSVSRVALPEWFDNLRDTVLVTGCGGGGGSGASNASAYGIGGGSAASAARAPLRLPPGIAALQVVVGQAGAAGSGSTAGSGGGTTSLRDADAASTVLIQLNGGTGGASNIDSNLSTGLGGKPTYMGSVAAISTPESDSTTSYVPSAYAVLMSRFLGGWPDGAIPGQDGYRTTFSGIVRRAVSTTACATTLHGGGSNVLAGGYGYGGARNPSMATASGQAGGNGFLLLEFIEGDY